MRSIILYVAMGLVACGAGCAKREPPYGTERPLSLPTAQRQTWAVAPAINLSGEREVDPLLQADLLFQQLQQVRGVTVIPVDRVVEVYASLRIDRVQSEEQAALVVDLLGCDALLVPTVTAYDPYDPPKLGAALQLFTQTGTPRSASVDPRELARRATPLETDALPTMGRFVQVVGMYDASAGSVREAVLAYAEGRSDPVGPYGPREYFVSMDRYSGFVYHDLIAKLLRALE